MAHGEPRSEGANQFFQRISELAAPEPVVAENTGVAFDILKNGIITYT